MRVAIFTTTGAVANEGSKKPVNKPVTQSAFKAEGLRKRGASTDPDKSGGDTITNTRGTADKSTAVAVMTGKDDPIFWFGMLSPRPLKHSQAKFKEMVRRSIVVAGIRCRMAVIRSEYATLLKKKADLRS